MPKTTRTAANAITQALPATQQSIVTLPTNISPTIKRLHRTETRVKPTYHPHRHKALHRPCLLALAPRCHRRQNQTSSKPTPRAHRKGCGILRTTASKKTATQQHLSSRMCGL